jgi:hypothetical protein
MPDRFTSSAPVELGEETLKRLAKLIEDAVARGFDRVQIPPVEDVGISRFSPGALDDLTEAVREAVSSEGEE